MDSEGQAHNHFMPGKDLVDINGQAMQFGYVFPVFVTRSIADDCIVWALTKGKHAEVTAEKRIYELLDSCYTGMGKALASEPDRVFYKFKHWYWERGRPNAKKQNKLDIGARLLLYPETEEPWLLIFDPIRDGEEVVQRGKSEKDRGANDDIGEVGLADSADMDDGGTEVSGSADNVPNLRSVT